MLGHVKGERMADELPECFGDPNVHDAKDPECKGGYDPSYTESPDHIRAKCGVFEACGARARAKEAAIKAQNTAARYQQTQNRPSYQQPQSRPVTLSNYSRSASVQAPQPQQQQQPTFVAPQNLQPQQAPVMVPAQMMPVNYGMPSYLSVLEPKRMKKGKKWKSLTHEIGRSMGKSIGHSFAFFFDSVPWSDDDD